MDLEDVDAWYEEQKESITEKYLAKLRKFEDRLKQDMEKKNRKKPLDEGKKDNSQPPSNTSPSQQVQKEKQEPNANTNEEYHKKRAILHDTLKHEYLARMKKLHEEYTERSQKGIDQNLKKHFFWHRVDMLKKRLRQPVDDFMIRFKKKEKEE